MNRPESIQKKKRNNRGFSLIELIVTMAVMVVLAGAIFGSMNLLSGRQAKSCRDKLLSRLDNVRTTTMGKRTAVASLENDGTGYVLKVNTTLDNANYEEKSYKLSGTQVTMYYSTNSDGSDRQQISSTPLKIEFDRSSGAQKAQADGTYIRHIYAVQNGREYAIKLYPETGKIQRED